MNDFSDFQQADRSVDYWKNKLETWVNDPYQFACDVVFTQDAVDSVNPIKRFPQQFEYLKVFTKIWLTEKRMAVPKSRRMFMSWYCVILHLWDTMFHGGRNIAFVSKKEDDANELIQRCIFILENIKEEDWPKELRPRYEDKFNFIKFPQLNSTIQGFPQGADQLRQFTFSRIMADEMAFWDQAKQMYASSVPTLEGGGAITAISSAAPGFFKQLVHDELNDDPAPTPTHFFPMEGVEVWRNSKNRFVIFQLHYSANEAKRDPQYRANIKSDLPYSSYMQEYEISWETHHGKPVYIDWNKAVHGNKIEEFADLGTPIFLGVDQGLTPACVVFQPQGEDIIVLREYTAENMGSERFCDLVIASLRVDFKEWANLKDDFLVGIDPTALNRRDVDERSYAAPWQKHFTVMGGENSFEKRKNTVERCLMKFHKGKPTFRVNLPNCPVLVRGFDGEYHYPDKMFEVEPNKIRPLKNFAANTHDALQYGLTVFHRYRKKRRTSVPSPQYNFSGGALNGSQRRA
jgi:hypothetical protein